MDNASRSNARPQTVLRLAAMLAVSEMPIGLGTLAAELGCGEEEVSAAVAELAAAGLPVTLSGEEADSPRRQVFMDHPGLDGMELSWRAVARLGCLNTLLNALLPASMADAGVPPMGARPLGRPVPLPSSSGWPAESGHERDDRLGRAEDGGQGESAGPPAGEDRAEVPGRVVWHPLLPGTEAAARVLLEAMRGHRTCVVDYLAAADTWTRACLAPMRVHTAHDAVWFTCWPVTSQGKAEPLSSDSVFLPAHRVADAVMEDRDTSDLPVPEPRKPDLFGGDYNRPFQLQIVVSPPAADYVEARLWDEDQSVTRLKNGDLQVDLGTASPEAALSFVLSLGSHARVVTPSWLRKRVIATCRAILEKDGKKGDGQPADGDGTAAGEPSEAPGQAGTESAFRADRPVPNAQADGRQGRRRKE